MAMKEQERENLSLLIIGIVGLIAIGAVVAILGPVVDDFSITGAATMDTSLQVTPNPCTIMDGELCLALVKWSVPETEYSQVWVSVNGNQQMYFGCSEGEYTTAELAPWIGKERFEFFLYEATSCEKEDRVGEPLMRVVATGSN